jgi:ADP-ribosyl-[dinitrogen reductase] hydrolase
MLHHIAIGDAYGAGFEFSGRDKIERFNTLAGYVQHDLGIPAGHYTDDTQMSVAVAQVLLEDAPHASTADDFATAFVRTFRRDPRPGYAKGLQALLSECQDGEALRRRIRPDSRRNGAAMRSVPLALIEDKALLTRLAATQASVTHDTPEGRLSSQVVALMGNLMLYEGLRVSQLRDAVARETGFELDGRWHAEVACDAVQTLHAVHTALVGHRDLPSLLRACVDFGGDVDSVAAIALGLASLAHEYARDLPHELAAGLENGAFGSTFLRQTDEALARKYPAMRAFVVNRAPQ